MLLRVVVDPLVVFVVFGFGVFWAEVPGADGFPAGTDDKGGKVVGEFEFWGEGETGVV